METKLLNLVMVEFSANVAWGVYKYTYILKITDSEDEAVDIVESYMQIEDPVKRTEKIKFDFFTDVPYNIPTKVDGADVHAEVYYAWYDTETGPILAGGAEYVE